MVTQTVVLPDTTGSDWPMVPLVDKYLLVVGVQRSSAWFWPPFVSQGCLGWFRQLRAQDGPQTESKFVYSQHTREPDHLRLSTEAHCATSHTPAQHVGFAGASQGGLDRAFVGGGGEEKGGRSVTDIQSKNKEWAQRPPAAGTGCECPPQECTAQSGARVCIPVNMHQLLDTC